MTLILAGCVFSGSCNVQECKARMPDIGQGKATCMDRVERNKATMRRFETAVNTADARLIEELVCKDAPFLTPASPEPLYGGKGYLSIVLWMRAGFSDV